jgi:hypothetical protein
MLVSEIQNHINDIIERSYNDSIKLTILDEAVLYKAILALENLPDDEY